MNTKTRLFESTLIACAVLLLLALPAAAEKTEEQQEENVIVLGAQDADVDADEGRDAKFDKNSDTPGGIVVDYFRWSNAGPKNWIQIQAWDTTQRDERFGLRAGVGDKLRFRAGYRSLPYRYGSGASFVLGQGSNDMFGPTFRIADFVQQTLQAPDGDTNGFFDGDTGDNMLVQGLTNDLLAGAQRFNLESRRRAGEFGLTYQPSSAWTIDFDINHEKRDGLQSLGSGTYQRITDVDGVGGTDYDYFFSVRGIELPGVIDYSTTRFGVSAGYTKQRWFFTVGTTLSEFDNQYVGITYDNPFWFDGVDATSGSRRGLWEEGRVSLEPSNEAWDLTFTGGVNLGTDTRIVASVSLGEHSQDDKLMPITTNPATIGTVDINGDGNTDGFDDPTVAPALIPGLPATLGGLPTVGTSLNASSDTMAYNLTITNRSVDRLVLTGRLRSYEYEGTEGIQVVPARTEYIESRVKTDFKGAAILHVPLNFTRETIDLEAAYRFSKSLKLKGFLRMKSYDYAQYVDSAGNSSRESGSRAVSGTDDDIYGLTAMFAAAGWFSGRATLQTSDRTFDGSYTQGFSGENTLLRQFDIANRERDAADVHFDFMASEAVTIGVGYRMFEDDFPDSVYGYTAAESTGFDVSLNYAAPNGLNVFAYVDDSEWDVDMHLRTKCSNCGDPTPALAPWDIPNYDWFSDYTDSSTSFGAGVSFAANDKTKIDFTANYTDAEIVQLTENPDTPIDLSGGSQSGEIANVALGFDFPDQENTLLSAELKVTHRLSDRVACGFWWLYEDFDLDDFQWNSLEPYGNNFLSVDDATRYLFLDSRYAGYTAHVVQLFMKFSF